MKNKTRLPNDEFPKITLPWLIIGISSMVMFLVFLVAMYFNFHTAWFFCVWMWIIAGSLIFDGISKQRSGKAIGKLSLIMGVVAFIAGVLIINMQK